MNGKGKHSGEYDKGSEGKGRQCRLRERESGIRSEEKAKFVRGRRQKKVKGKSGGK